MNDKVKLYIVLHIVNGKSALIQTPIFKLQLR